MNAVRPSEEREEEIIDSDRAPNWLGTALKGSLIYCT